MFLFLKLRITVTEWSLWVHHPTKCADCLKTLATKVSTVLILSKARQRNSVDICLIITYFNFELHYLWNTLLQEFHDLQYKNNFNEPIIWSDLNLDLLEHIPTNIIYLWIYEAWHVQHDVRIIHTTLIGCGCFTHMHYSFCLSDLVCNCREADMCMLVIVCPYTSNPVIVQNKIDWLILKTQKNAIYTDTQT